MNFKEFCLVNIPICFAGCAVMLALKKMMEVDFGIIPFIIWGVLSEVIAEELCKKFNWFKK